MDQAQEKGGIFFGMWDVFSRQSRQSWRLLLVAALLEIPNLALTFLLKNRGQDSFHLGVELLGFLLEGFAACTLIMIALASYRKEFGEAGGTSDDLFRCFLLSLVAYFLGLLGVIFGLALLVVPGIILALGWAISVPIAALEGVGPIDALYRSYRMTRGFKLDILLAWFLLALIPIAPRIPLVIFKESIPGADIVLVVFSAAHSTLLACFSVGLFRFLKLHSVAGAEPGRFSLKDPVASTEPIR